MKNALEGWLFLDFDGVICDSLEECFRSSWFALSQTLIGKDPPPEISFPAGYRAQFLLCRPFIRSGEDYLVVHELLGKGIVPSSQAEFDVQLEVLGPEVLLALKLRLYEVRERLLEYHRGLWLSWNPLYAPMKALMLKLSGNRKVRILSTKKAEFIQEILAYENIDWPLDRIIYSSSRRKLDWIADTAGEEQSLLIDDQIEHLDFSSSSCDCHLALWGYVTSESRLRAAKTLTLDQVSRVLQPWTNTGV